MAWRQIDRARWKAFFEQVTKGLIGKQATIEIASLDLGDQVEAQRAPLLGVAYDDKEDLIEIALDALDHLIRSPREVFVDFAVGGLASIAVVDRDGNRQIVRLTDPLFLPAAGGDGASVDDGGDGPGTRTIPVRRLSHPQSRLP